MAFKCSCEGLLAGVWMSVLNSEPSFLAFRPTAYWRTLHPPEIESLPGARLWCAACGRAWFWCL